MSETGSHGGSSEGEVRTPLLFISSAFEKRSGKCQRSLTFKNTLASLIYVSARILPEKCFGLFYRCLAKPIPCDLKLWFYPEFASVAL